MAVPAITEREEMYWLNAAHQVLTQAQHPMHYTDIKRIVIESGLVPPGLKTTLEAALCKEAQSASRSLQLVDGQPGVFAVVAKQETLRVATTSARPLRLTGDGRVKNIARYRDKYRKIKRLVKEMVFRNAAICDEVVRLEDKIHRVKEERRYLLRRLLQQQALSETLRQPPHLATVSTPTSSSRPASQSIAQLLGEVEKRRKKASSKKKTNPDETSLAALKGDGSPTPKVGKRLKSGGQKKKRVTPIPLDNSGRPIFPIELGSLTVYCLGEIVPQPGYYSMDCIYPVGYCSTRVYRSMNRSQSTCLYTCKVSEGGTTAQFEISPEDAAERTFTGSTPSQCHRQLLNAINSACCNSSVPVDPKGAEFFGLSHPTIQNLIQSCPGARKCTTYRWTKFEVSRSDAEVYVEDDASVNVTLLSPTATVVKVEPEDDGSSATDTGSSLRCLLTA